MLEERSKKYRVLTNEEFVEAIKNEDMDLVIDCTLPLVRSIANGFCETTDPKPLRYTFDELFEDYLSIGMEAVWRASLKYDEAKGVNFITLAKIVVTKAMITRYKQFMGGNIDYNKRDIHNSAVKFDYEFRERDYDGNRKTLDPANEEVDMFEGIDKELFIGMIDKYVASEGQAKALKLKYGIIGLDDKFKTNNEVAKVMGVSFQCVQQLIIKGLGRLQENKELFKELLN